MATKITFVCDKVHLFVISATCHVSVGDVCDTAIVLFGATSTTWLAHSFFLSLVDRLAHGQTSQCTRCIFIHVRCDENGSSLRLSVWFSS